MKIIIDIPNSAVALASMLLSDDMKQETIDAAVKRCEETPTELDMKLFAAKARSSNSDLQAFNMGLAICAIGMAVEKLKNESKEEDSHEK